MNERNVYLNARKFSLNTIWRYSAPSTGKFPIQWGFADRQLQGYNKWPFVQRMFLLQTYWCILRSNSYQYSFKNMRISKIALCTFQRQFLKLLFKYSYVVSSSVEHFPIRLSFVLDSALRWIEHRFQKKQAFAIAAHFIRYIFIPVNVQYVSGGFVDPLVWTFSVFVRETPILKERPLEENAGLWGCCLQALFLPSSKKCRNPIGQFLFL